jgi:DNA repair protein RecN (Recombination protein N)
MAFGEEVTERLMTLESHDATVARLEAERAKALDELAAVHRVIGDTRRAAASAFAAAVEERLRSLAMPRARLEVTVGDVDPGDDVVFLLGANPGEPMLPLSKVASGGELSRTMLALRLVLSGVAGSEAEGPSTLIFDEVDAGVGGEAALAVGQALAALSATRQVIVVTHLAQVAAFADHHVVVHKAEEGGRTVATAAPVIGDDRLRELSRMLSGQPDSRAARRHAEDLLRTARGQAA